MPNERHYQSYHPDEYLISQVAETRPYFLPGFYNYGTLYFTLLKIGGDMGSSYGWAARGDNVPSWQTDRGFAMTGRAINCVAGAATAGIVFAILALFAGGLGAGIGAFAMAIAPGHVVHSRFQTSDVFATFLIALSLYFMLRLVKNPGMPKLRPIVLAAAAAGLAAGTKYLGAVLVIPLLLTLFLVGSEGPKVPIKPALAVVGVFLAAFFLATPGIVFDNANFMMGVGYELAHSASGHGIVFQNTANGFVYHLANMIESFGGIPFIIGVSGIAVAVIKRNYWAVILAVFFVAYYIVIGRAEVKFLRYVLPLLPVLAVGVGWAVDRVLRRGRLGRIGAAALGLLVILSMGGSHGAIQLTSFMVWPDPRDQAAEWLLANKGRVGFVSDPWFYSPPLAPDMGLLGGEQRMAAIADSPKIVRFVNEDGTRKDWDTQLLTVGAPEYVVFSSFEFLDADRISDPDLIRFMEVLQTNYRLAGIFWDKEPAFPPKDAADQPVTRDLMRAIMKSRFPTTHDMMYIRPTLCVFQKRQN